MMEQRRKKLEKGEGDLGSIYSKLAFQDNQAEFFSGSLLKRVYL